MRTLLPFATLLSAVFILGCQESGPAGPDSEIVGPAFDHNPKAPPGHGTPPAAFSAVVRNVGPIQNLAECVIVPPPPPLVLEGCIIPETIEGDISSMDGTPVPGLVVIDQELDATGNGEFEARSTFGALGDLACVTDPSGNTLCGIFELEAEGDFIAGTPFHGVFELEGISEDVEGVEVAGTVDETGVGTNIFTLAGTIRFPD